MARAVAALAVFAAAVRCKVYMPGDANYYVKMMGLSPTDGMLDPSFDPETTDYTLRIGNTKVKSVSLTLGLDLTKYHPMHCPAITVNGETFKYTPLSPLIYTYRLDHDIGPVDQVLKIRVADPSGGGGGFNPFSGETAREYNVRVMQAPEFKKVVLAVGVEATTDDGQELKASPPFVASKAEHAKAEHTFQLPLNSSSVALKVQCSRFATGMTVDGDQVEINSTYKFEMLHSHMRVMVQCQYGDEMWTPVVRERTYTFDFNKKFDLGDVEVALMMNEDEGYCAMRGKKFDDDDGKGKIPSVEKGFVCRASSHEAGFFVLTTELRPAYLLSTSPHDHGMLLKNAIPRKIHIPHKRSQFTLKVVGGEHALHYPVEMIVAATCDTLQCPKDTMPRPEAHSGQRAESRLCFEPKCSMKDSQHCCTMPPSCETLEECPGHKVHKPNAAELFCKKAPCSVERDEDHCCGEANTCGSWKGECKDGKKRRPMNADCHSNPCDLASGLENCCEEHDQAAAKLARENARLKKRAMNDYEEKGCHPTPMHICYGQKCFYDETCALMPPRHGGLGCWAGGLDRNCRFCGFGIYEKCPQVIEATECEIRGCENWHLKKVKWCHEMYNIQCPEVSDCFLGDCRLWSPDKHDRCHREFGYFCHWAHSPHKAHKHLMSPEKHPQHLFFKRKFDAEEHEVGAVHLLDFATLLFAGVTCVALFVLGVVAGRTLRSQVPDSRELSHLSCTEEADPLNPAPAQPAL